MARATTIEDSRTSSRRVTSIIQDHGLYHSTCGYCKSHRRTSASHGLLANRLTINDYQELLDRGWRRSGMLLYKPQGSQTCCPPYTIRLEADAFVASKEQKRVRRRMQRYLDGEYDGSRNQENVISNPSGHGSTGRHDLTDEAAATILASLKAVIADWMKDSPPAAHFQIPELAVRRVSEKLKKQLKDVNGEAEYTSNAAFLVASLRKRMHNLERKSDEGKSKALGVGKEDLSPTDLANILASNLKDHQSLEGVSVKACKGHLNFYTASSKPKAVFNSQRADGMAIETSNGTCERVLSNEEEPRKRVLEIRMQRSSFDPEEFQLYKRYQVAVHQDRPEDVQEKSYRRFLVDSPLVPVQHGSVGYGSFHQQYRIDGQLVAVGVVDVLPKCLSSKYLFWDPDFAFLSLGKFSVLQEIEWVQGAHQQSPLLQYYYLGYYIQSCPKMRYKAAYFPSDLLCPVDYEWVPFHIARPVVESGASMCICHVPASLTVQPTVISRGESSSAIEDEDMNDISEAHEFELEENGHSSIEDSAEHNLPNEFLGDIPLLLNSRCLKLKDLDTAGVFEPKFLNTLKWQLLKYLQAVGSRLASRMGYYLVTY